MNPYLEREGVWHDFHERFIPRAAEALTPQVRPGYIVQLDENIYVHELPADERRLIGRPDIGLARDPFNPSSTAAGAAAIAAPAYGKIPAIAVDTDRLSFIEIRDRDSRQLVTVIELLSPANKGSDRQQYLRKRNEYLMAGVALVEIDLLRGGNRLPIEGLGACDYYLLVARPEESPRVGLWPLTLRSPLATLPVPLRPPTPDARLELQTILHQVYDAAGYEDYIYREPPSPTLGGEDQRWTDSFLKR
jgi:hypothetical protein